MFLFFFLTHMQLNLIILAVSKACVFPRETSDPEDISLYTKTPLTHAFPSTL